MNNNIRQPEPPAGMSLGDIYFVLFRHKWKIILLSLAGVLAAAVTFYLRPPPSYQSEAALLVRYVLDTRAVNPGAANGSAQISLDDQGENIINAEIAILTSLDVADKVVEAIGAEKILAKVGGGKDPFAAASMVRGGLIVQPSRKSSVINVVFEHPDPTIVRQVLRTIIDAYLTKHREIRNQPSMSDESINIEAGNLRKSIEATEKELREAKTNIGIVSLEDTKKTFAEVIPKLTTELLNANVELEEHQSELQEMAKYAPAQPTNTVSALEIPEEKVYEYLRIRARLEFLRKRDQDYSILGYKDANKLVKAGREEIAEVVNLKREFEAEYPKLPSVQQSGTPSDYMVESGRVLQLESKIRILNNQLKKQWAEYFRVAANESEIQALETKSQIQRENYRYFLTTKIQAGINASVGPGSVSGINATQEPSRPFRARPKSLKPMAMMIMGGIMGGLAWAFLIELYLDRSVKRPAEIETKLKLPLFLSIPDTSRNGHRRLDKLANKRRLLIKNGEGDPAADAKKGDSEKSSELEIVPLSANQSLRSFYEALRDRLVVYFEAKNLTRKPKLVAVTSANRGAGVSTIAMGLAVSLSETGDGSVLLVDMNLEQGAARPFHNGKPGCLLDDAFEKEKRGSALIQDNLYVVSEGSNTDKLSRNLPKRFNALVPKLKASDYDYIIFDMPPISQTSPTLRLAGYMDMVLMVIESEKTNREVVQRATALLAESKANVTAVLNKTRQYVPARLRQELSSDS